MGLEHAKLLVRDGPRPWRRVHFAGIFAFQAWCWSIVAAAELTDWLDGLGWPAGLALLPLPLATIFILWSAAERRLRRRVESRAGAICATCAYDLSATGDPGTCPECGRGYTLGNLRHLWLRCGVLRPGSPSPSGRRR